jgi:hypothetical protein
MTGHWLQSRHQTQQYTWPMDNGIGTYLNSVLIRNELRLLSWPGSPPYPGDRIPHLKELPPVRLSAVAHRLKAILFNSRLCCR